MFSSLNSGSIVSLSVMLGVLVYITDLVTRAIKSRDKFNKEERDSLKEPIEIRGTILDNTRDAVTMQSALLLNAHEEINRLRVELDMKNTELAEANKDRQSKRMEIAKLYSIIYDKRNTKSPEDNSTD